MLFRMLHSGEWSMVSLKPDFSTRLQVPWGLGSSLLAYCYRSAAGLALACAQEVLVTWTNKWLMCISSKASDLLIFYPYKLPAILNSLFFLEYARIFLSSCLFACYFFLVSCLSISLSTKKLSSKRLPAETSPEGSFIVWVTLLPVLQ